MALGIFEDLRICNLAQGGRQLAPVPQELLLPQKGPPGLSEPLQGRRPSDMLRVPLSLYKPLCSTPGEVQGFPELTCSSEAA